MTTKIPVSTLLSLGTDKEKQRLSYEEIILRIHRLSDHLAADVQHYLEPYNLQQADFSILISLYRQGTPYISSPTQLYQTMLFSSGGLTKVLKRVEDFALIHRIDNLKDKRSKLVQLTPLGLQHIENILDKIKQSRHQRFSCLEIQEQKEMELLLTKLLANWE
ncbi:MarR family winged helix-turn-helix transcriptional regulator [Vibrio casei]|uniref:MarR family transcriptional regulator n=1 Tax=Vibrio casei TaxID=673372 RepID=A0A368LP33_9VIBR|nr:MarR family transcriptional regulator [Vibrio casei]RCS73669.1 MarR family transcriptional regulator [Vibrio casei]SJN16385.1 Transcriptional regulator, MarR family [Vibrio casei]